MIFHLTDRHVFKECRRKYHYGLIQRLTPKDENQTKPIIFGTAGHDVLKRYYRGEDCELGFHLFLDEQREQGRDLLGEYFDYYKDDWQIASVEQTIDVPLENGDILQFTMDVLALEKGKYWIVDHKFLSTRPDPRALQLNDQMTGYIWGARKMGIPVEGAIYNVIVKNKMEPLRLLKNGTLSVAPTTLANTTHAKYLGAIKAHGLNVEDYQEQLDELAQRAHPFLIRLPIRRNDYELQQFEKQLYAEIEDIKSERTVFYPNPTRNCGWCQYYDLCKAQNEGGDVESLIENLFRVKEDHER